MAIHKVLGTETEYGIVVRGDPRIQSGRGIVPRCQ